MSQKTLILVFNINFIHFRKVLINYFAIFSIEMLQKVKKPFSTKYGTIFPKEKISNHDAKP